MRVQLTVNALFDGILAVLRFRNDFVEKGVAVFNQLLQMVASDVALEQPFPKLSECIDLIVGYIANAFFDLYSVERSLG